MKWLMVIRLIIVFAPMIQKLFSGAGSIEKDQALRAGIDKAENLFPKFKKVSKQMQPKDLAGIINLFEWFAGIEDEEKKNSTHTMTSDRFHDNER